MRSHIFTVLLMAAVVLSFGNYVYSQPDAATQQLAKRLVQSASVKEGDVVVIDGGRHMVPLMEAVAIETQKVGGRAVMWLESDRVTHSFNADVPEKYLEQEPRFFAEWLKQVNVYIGLPTFEDPKAVIEGVPEARLAKIAKAGEFFSGIINSLPVRLVAVDYPTPQSASIAGLDFPTYQRTMMDAVNADYAGISAKGSQLSQILQNARQIRITNPAGTDFTVSTAQGREVFVDDGIVTPQEAQSKLFFQRVASLPGGAAIFAPLETSANGKVVVSKDMCRFSTVSNASFEFRNGTMQNFKADANGKCIEDTLQPYTGAKDVLGTISFGLNPALHVMEDGNANFRPGAAAGMVSIGLGDNRLFGGNNSSTGGYNFAITNATVTVDGKTVIKDGKLVI